MNNPSAYIEKTAKAALAFMAAFALITGSLMLCCMNMTQASAHGSKVCSHCQQGKAGLHQADHSKTCDCCKIRPADSDALGKLFDLVPSLAKNLHNFCAVEALRYLPQCQSSHLAYTGPPRGHGPVPIYIQLSSFRL